MRIIKHFFIQYVAIRIFRKNIIFTTISKIYSFNHPTLKMNFIAQAVKKINYIYLYI